MPVEWAREAVAVVIIPLEMDKGTVPVVVGSVYALANRVKSASVNTRENLENRLLSSGNPVAPTIGLGSST